MLAIPYLSRREGQEVHKGDVPENQVSEAQCRVQIGANMAEEDAWEEEGEPVPHRDPSEAHGLALCSGEECIGNHLHGCMGCWASEAI